MSADEIAKGKIENCGMQYGGPGQEIFITRSRDCLGSPGILSGAPSPYVGCPAAI